MLYADPFLTVYCCLLAALLGACMGSFLNCAAWRIVHGESVLRGRSHCDACGHVLAVRDLIPVVSYLAAHGPLLWGQALPASRSGRGRLGAGVRDAAAAL